MNSTISVNIVIFSGEKIIFIKNESVNGIKLVLPGGRLRDGEDIKSFTSRVAAESAGIAVKIDNKLSGVITRSNKEGKLMVTFIMLAEVNDTIKNSSAVLIPYENIERYASISNFSMYIIKKLKSCGASGLNADEFQAPDGRKYLSYF